MSDYEKTTTPDIIADAQLEVVCMVDELGTVAHGLREAFRNFENGHEMQAEEDAILAEQALENLERLAMECRHNVERWREGIECIHCGGSGAGHKGHCPSIKHTHCRCGSPLSTVGAKLTGVCAFCYESPRVSLPNTERTDPK